MEYFLQSIKEKSKHATRMHQIAHLYLDYVYLKIIVINQLLISQYYEGIFKTQDITHDIGSNRLVYDGFM